MSLLEKKVQNIWLITFGDLLTLLLCFFIAIITLSSSGKRSFTEAEASPPGTLAPDASAAKPTGIIVAQQSTEARPQLTVAKLGNETTIELLFNEQERHDAGQFLREALSPYIDTQKLKSAGGDVEACSGAASGGDEAAAMQSVALALQVRSQIIDLLPGAGALRLRGLGKSCEALGPGIKGEIPGRDAVLRVTMRFSEA